MVTHPRQGLEATQEPQDLQAPNIIISAVQVPSSK